MSPFDLHSMHGSVWKHHNNMVFDDMERLLDSLINVVKLLVWSWIKSKAKCFSYAYYISMDHSTTRTFINGFNC